MMNWLADGNIAVGNWEPLAFRLRTWSLLPRNCSEGYADGAAEWQAEHTEEKVAALARAGVGMIITHFYKGFGLQSRIEGIDLARNLAAHCRKHGIRVGAYVQWANYVPETLVQEEPECESWAVVDRCGEPHLPYGSRQWFRWQPCYSNPAVVRHLKNVITKCVKVLDPDLIHLDNFHLGRIEHACQCNFCQQRFDDYIAARYDDQAFARVFGYERRVQLRIPDYREPFQNFVGRYLRDPVAQAFVRFRTELLVDTLREIVAHGKSLKGDLCFDINCGGLNGVNSHLCAGRDYSRLANHVEMIWDEEACYPRITQTGACVSKFRTYKLARNHDLTVAAYAYNRQWTERDCRKLLAEALTFNRSLTIYCDYYGVPAAGPSAEILSFFHSHRELFAQREPVSDVAIFRVVDSLSYSLGNEWAHQMVAEQYLFEKGYAFDILFDNQMDRLNAYRAVLLSGASVLSEEFEDALIAYVAKGGGLVLLGNVGHLTGDLYQRDSDFHRRLLQRGARQEPGNLLTLEKGRVCVVDRLQFAAEYPAEETYSTGKNFYEYWLIPKNAKEIAAALKKAVGEPLRFETSATKGIVFEYYRQGEGYEVHILDLADRQGLDCRLRFACGAGQLPEATCITLHGQQVCRTKEVETGIYEIHIQDRHFDTYGVLVLSSN